MATPEVEQVKQRVSWDTPDYATTTDDGLGPHDWLDYRTEDRFILCCRCGLFVDSADIVVEEKERKVS